MRKSIREQAAETGSAKAMGLDYHEGLTKSVRLEDVDLSEETGMTRQQIVALKARLQRG
jgi:hypothetical protein